MKRVFLSLIICLLFAGATFAAMNDSDFIKLCKEGYLNQIVDAVKGGANVNARGEGGITPLMAMAARKPINPVLIKALLGFGADMETKDKDGKMAADHAIAAENDVFIDVLIEASNGLVSVSYFEVYFAGSLQKVNDAINNGADMNARCEDGKTPLMYAAQGNSNPEVIAAIIKAGADVNARDIYRETPIFYATWGSNPEVVKALINAGADVNARSNNGFSPLMNAAIGSMSSSEVITTLIKAGAKVNVKDEYGMTPLIFAAKKVIGPEFELNPEVITILLNAGADPKVRDSSRKMAIDYAKENEKLKNTDVFWNLNDMTDDY
ncbi:MAG: ankyrin repeat domain-containing protein [Synergistaceae bacterium]|nr:ankyrin repeat domain-containing protein [Synergistaceae bacterium]